MEKIDPQYNFQKNKNSKNNTKNFKPSNPIPIPQLNNNKNIPNKPNNIPNKINSLHQTLDISEINIKDDKEDSQISETVNVNSGIYQKSEETTISKLTGTQGIQIQNWLNKSFIPINNSNSLDDLDQLLQQSYKYQSILDQCKKTGEKFDDKDFVKNTENLLGYETNNKMIQQRFSQVVWARFEKIIKPPYIIFDKMEQQDILQGQLGDCYFLAAICSIANYPNRLKRIFLIKKHNPFGIYVVALCINGIWQDVILDEYIPCTKNILLPAFTHTKSKELWMILLEKAWAKIHGAYFNINAGLTREALRDLTGASAKTIFTDEYKDKQNVFWKKLVKYYDQKFILCAGSDQLSSDGKDIFISKIGIAGSHAYSILQILELIYYDNKYVLLSKNTGEEQIKYNNQIYKVERVLKLRNPWGKGEWKGKWSDQDGRWTDGLRKELNHEVRDDGMFFIDLVNFMKYFSDFQVCKFHDGFKYSALKIQTLNESETYINFQIHQKGIYYFSLNQINKRFFPPSTNYEYSPHTILIGYVDQNQKLVYVGSGLKADKENWIQSIAEKGNYFVYIKSRWISFVNEFSFSVYGEQKTNIKQIDKSQVPINYLNRIFFHYSKLNKQNEKQLGQGLIMRKLDSKKGFGYLFIKNTNKDKQIYFNVDISASENIKPLFPFQSMNPSLTVRPMKGDIIVYEAIGYPYKADMKISFLAMSRNAEIIDLLKQQGKLMDKKKYNYQEVDIKQLVLNTKDGIYILTINKTELYVLSEQYKFFFENCLLQNKPNSTEFELIVRPGEEILMSIKRLDNNKEYDCFIMERNPKVFHYFLNQLNCINFRQKTTFFYLIQT